MSTAVPAPLPQPVPERLVSLDAYRGFTMLLMACSSWRWLPPIVAAYPESGFLQGLHHQFQHLSWAGCTVWDMIQPSFMFMVGVSLAYSFAKRQQRGDRYRSMFWHAVRRALVLILLGVFLRSFNFRGTYWTFEDVLTQIGLGYVFLFLLAGRPLKWQLTTLAMILVGYWALFALWPLPSADFDPATVAAADPAVQFEGFAAHWNKNTHPAHEFDRWFLNLFPRPVRSDGVDIGPFAYHSGGYHTLSFIPSLGTMILGLFAAQILRSGGTGRRKLLWLILAGLGLLLLGAGLERLGISPIVKRIWTPGWAIFSGGWCFLILAAFYAIIDLVGWRRWAFVGVVVGLNPITFYVMGWIVVDWINANLGRHLGTNFFKMIAGQTFGPLLGTVVLVSLLWLIVYWMYRRKLFLRI